MTRVTRVVALAGAGAIALAVVAPSAALAGEQASFARAAGGATAGVDADSTVNAGYVSALTNKKTIGATFVVPDLGNCSSDAGIISIVELAGNGGSPYADGSVYSFCVDGVATHYAVFEGSSQEIIDEVVEDGDKIKVTSQFKGGSVKIKMQNVTQGWSANGTVGGVNPTEAGVYHWSMTSGGNPLPPLDYGNVAVTDVKVSGKDLKATSPTKVVLVDDNGDALITPSKIKKGTDFKFSYVG